MVGDQDVLTALLTSEEFAKIPIKILRRGNEIIQFFGLYGYTIRERIMGCLGGGASFVHAQGSKPWLIRWHANTLREYFDRAYQDLSPYTMVAQEFSAQLGDAESWMRPHSNLSAILRVAALGYLPFSGLPIALAIDVVRLFKYFARHVSKD
jgi:hypothetical protein